MIQRNKDTLAKTKAGWWELKIKVTLDKGPNHTAGLGQPGAKGKEQLSRKIQRKNSKEKPRLHFLRM